MKQAQQVFMQGCGLPAAWAAQTQWCVLETGFELGLNFLVTWRVWQTDPARPRLLHFVSSEAVAPSPDDLLKAAAAHPELMPLAIELAAQCRGLLPGLHRFSFEQGRVLLSLGVGETKAMLKLQILWADSVYLNGLSAQQNPGDWDLNTIKAVARCCRRGTQLTTRTLTRQVTAALSQCGFEVMQTPGVLPSEEGFQAIFNPRWEPKKSRHAFQEQPRVASHCVVIGAGLAGAACAASLARRGWQVTVLEAHAMVAGGSSGLPAGMLAPHVSPDDSALSRLSRKGLRATWHAVRSLLREGQDWQACGVLQRRFDGSGALPADWPAAGEFWSRTALPSIGTDPAAHPDLWHASGGWIKPARLVQALLAAPGICTRLGVQVASLHRLGETSCPIWQVQDAAGLCIAEAALVVLAAGFDSATLLKNCNVQAASGMPLQAIRGQLAWGPVPQAADMPDFAVNGDGSFIPAFSMSGLRGDKPDTSAADSSPHWLMGASFDRDVNSSEIRAADQNRVFEQLQRLLPATAVCLKPVFEESRANAWAGVRCASPDRLPLVGALDDANLPGLHVCTALGSRGLTFAVLCGELLAAWLHGEPLPLENRLAQSMRASRFRMPSSLKH